MIDPPKRTGYRLTYYAECLYNDWQEIGGCSCHTGCAPCSSCHNVGHPISLEENDEAWELDEEEDMSRSCITDKGGTKAYGKCIRNDDYENGGLTVGKIYELRGSGSTVGFTGDDGTSWGCDRSRFVSATAPTETKSEWFGYKYRVTPETSKLLQEAVFKDSGRWGGAAHTTISYLGDIYLEVKEDGNIWRPVTDKGFSDSGLPEKQPPQAKKDFIVGKWYKCVENCTGCLGLGKWYEISKLSTDQPTCRVSGDNYNWFNLTRFDLSSESDYDPNAKISVAKDLEESTIIHTATGYELDSVALKSHIQLGNKSGNTATTTVGDTNMSTNTQRKTVTVNLIDRDTALDEKFALVATFGEFTTSKSSEALIRSIIIDPKNDVAKLITQHNEVRTKQTNKEILDRTGNKVTLEAVEESDLYWEIR